MKAIVCREFTGVDGLRYESVDSREPRRGEVKVRVLGAGMNFPDTLKVQGLYQVKPALPWIPGGEVAGVVSEWGPGVEGLSIGDRVMGVSDMTGGGFAQEIVLARERLLPFQDSLSFVEAAAIPVVYGTVLYALRQRAQLLPGETLLVLGAAGGVGLAAVQVGKAMGARVMAAASTESKRQLAKEQGADDVINYADPGWRDAVLRLTEGKGADVIFDPVGGDAFDEAIRCVAWSGRYLVVGFASGRIPTVKVNHPLLKNYDLRGVRYDVWRDQNWDQARANLEQVLQWNLAGLVRPYVSATFPFAEAAMAMRKMIGREVDGKIVLVPERVE